MMIAPAVGRCRYCQKVMRDRPLVGTLHVCLLLEERRAVDLRDAEATYAATMQARVVEGSYRLDVAGVGMRLPEPA